MAVAMPKWGWLALFLLGLLIFLFSISSILLPFIAGLAIAYLLDPVADAMERRRVPRWLAASIAIVGFFLILAGVLVAIWPLAAAQITGLVKTLPDYMVRLKPLLAHLLDQASPEDIKQAVSQFAGRALEVAASAAGTLIGGGLAVFNILGLLLITPVVAFYLLRDWDRLIGHVRSWLPARYENSLLELGRESDRVLAGFVRGQMLVVLGDMVLYAAGWTLLGLNYGLVLGLLAGFLAFIPYAGPAIGVGLALVVAIGQFGDNYLMIAAVFSVLLVVQTMESAVFQPRFLGGQVGLHPVWVILAVFAGGKLMGFVGILVAVPVAAVVAVLGRFALKRYLHSDLYGKPVSAAELPGQGEDQPR